jgi:hypothetical protein
MKLVACIWEDAAELDEGPWADRRGMQPSTPTIFHQVGYLCELTTQAVVMTACVGEDQMGPRTRIPIGMVRKLVELTEGEPVKIPKQRKTKGKS